MKILVMDSGIGGLTVALPIIEKLRPAEVYYWADTANLPYGTKSPEKIRKLATNASESLWDWASRSSQANPDALVVACNTASAFAMDSIRQVAAGIPVLGVVEAGCAAAIHYKPDNILVVATPATVKSQAYCQGLKDRGFEGPITQVACPLWVACVEDRLWEGDLIEGIIRRDLDPVVSSIDRASVAVGILGCTHFPILQPVLRQLYPQIHWIHGADYVCQEIGQKGFAKTMDHRAASGLFVKYSDPGSVQLEAKTNWIAEKIWPEGLPRHFQIKI